MRNRNYGFYSTKLSPARACFAYLAGEAPLFLNIESNDDETLSGKVDFATRLTRFATTAKSLQAGQSHAQALKVLQADKHYFLMPGEAEQQNVIVNSP